MSAALQMKLLRVLQEREFERVGDSHTTKVDVRVIAATNSDLARMVADGQFREDLFYRLNVIPVQLPPLRERKEDIPLLVQHFLDKFRADGIAGRAVAAAAHGLAGGDAPADGVRVARQRRQLENAIERAVAFSAGRPQIDVADLPPEIQQAQEPALAVDRRRCPRTASISTRSSRSIERELIQRSLERTGGNKGRAAKLLNLKRTTLVEKLKRHGKRSRHLARQVSIRTGTRTRILVRLTHRTDSDSLIWQGGEMLRAQGVCALIGALCFGLPSLATAQTMGVGVKGGLAIASMPWPARCSTRSWVSRASRVRQNSASAAGGYVRFPISTLFWFQPEALYVMKGANLTEADGQGTLSARLHYIDVPLLLHFRVRPEQRMPGYIFGGVNFGMKMGSSANLDGPAAAADVDLKPALKTLDVGIAFGGGVERGRYLVEARVTLGASDVGAESFPHLHKLRNRTIMVLFGRKLR